MCLWFWHPFITNVPRHMLLTDYKLKWGQEEGYKQQMAKTGERKFAGPEDNQWFSLQVTESG